MSERTASFVIEFVPPQGKAISNTLKLTIKSGTLGFVGLSFILLFLLFYQVLISSTGPPSKIKLTTKNNILKCGEAMPNVDVKINDQFGSLVCGESGDVGEERRGERQARGESRGGGRAQNSHLCSVPSKSTQYWKFKSRISMDIQHWCQT